MKELPKSWINLNDEQIIEKLNNEVVDLDIIEKLAESENPEISEAAEEADMIALLSAVLLSLRIRWLQYSEGLNLIAISDGLPFEIEVLKSAYVMP